MEDIHRLRCSINDDGEFTIPAIVTGLVPAGYSVDRNLTVTDRDIVEISTDRPYRIRVSATAIAQLRFQLSQQ